MTEQHEGHADRRLDGNAAAGALSQIFAVDVTVARGRCAHCGDQAAMAEAHLYVDAPGMVLRCHGCEEVLVRLVERPDGLYLDVSGVDHLVFELPPGTTEP